MNRNPTIVTIMIVLSFVCTIGYTQQTGTVTFTYDLDGNRISQTFSRDRGNENKGLAEDKVTITNPALDFFKEMQVELYPNPIHEDRFMEEYVGHIEVYKNQGLYPKATSNLVDPIKGVINMMERINVRYDEIIYKIPVFDENVFWHFIYKIPRRY